MSFTPISAPMTRLFKITRKIDETMLDAKIFEIKSRDFVIRSLEGVMEYTVVALRRNPSKKPQRVVFDELNLRRIAVVAFPGFSEQKGSVFKTSSGNRMGFDAGKLDENAQEFSFKFEIEHDIDSIVDDLVRRDRQVEATEEKNTYWLHAQLKEVETLERLLRKVDLRDISFMVDVAVFQDIKTLFPKRRLDELELVSKWQLENQRERKQALSMAHLRLRRQRPSEKEISKVLDGLQNLFIPAIFKSFVDVLQDFYYGDCFRSADFYDLIPFRTFPKFMTVICRTDLSIENPASEGQLIYKKAKFQEAVEEAITKK